MNFLYILFFVVAIIWLGWLIGYPIYKKVRGENVFDGSFHYSMGLLVGALVMNIINLITKLIK